MEKYGIDSILAMKLTNQLEKTFGVLSKTLFFEYQTIAELAQYFMHSHLPRLVTLFATTGNGNGHLEPANTRPEIRPLSQGRLDRKQAL